MSDIELHQQSPLAGQMEYARTVAASSIIPQAYRGKPADILVAVQLGAAMGLSPAESLYRIDVIQGTPTASAELIASNVRKAGHLLRLIVDEGAVQATCVIIRADDPGFEHVVVRDEAWAKRMGLSQKDNYKKQAATMLGWRAVTACARKACSEALFGVAYTPDEIDAAPVASAPRGLAAVLAKRTAPAEVEAPTLTEPEPPTETGELRTEEQSKKLFAIVTKLGWDRDDTLGFINATLALDEPIESTKHLTVGQASVVIRALEAEPVDAEPIQGEAE